MRILWLAILLACLLGVPAVAGAQGWTRLGGRVTGPGGSPVAGARVQVSADPGQRAEARADSSGSYAVRIASAGPFVVSVEAPGMIPATRVVDRAAGGADVKADFELAVRIVALEPIAVRAEPLTVAAATRWVPGSIEKSRPALEMRTEPLGSDLLAELAERQVGVARVATPEGPGLSIAGQAPGQTRLTIDGADAGTVAIPREAIRSLSVLTNTYDVSRGRFTGGQVDVRTQRAGNEWGGTFRLEGRAPGLQYGAVTDAAAAYTAVDGGGGGALLRDRLFVFGAVTARRTETPALSLTDLGRGGLARLGISQDTLDRFLELTRGWRPPDAGASERVSGFTSGLLRLDAVLSPRHTVMLRLNGQSSRFDDLETASSVRGTETGVRGSGFGVLAQVSSGGGRLAHELKVSLTAAERAGASADPAPAGIVTLATGDPDGGAEVLDLRFAGSPFTPRDVRDRGIDVTDQLVLTTADRSHRFRAGLELGLQRHRRLPAAGLGAFVFESLADLQERRPALFTRSYDTGEVDAEGRRAAFFLDDHWTSGPFQLSYGIRAERASYSAGQAANPAVEAAFGRAPGAIPAPWRVSPRLGFAFDGRMPWDRGPHGRTSIQGGIGEFVGGLSLSGLGAAMAETGLAGTAELSCVGPAAPVPDWTAYRADPGTIPWECADGSSSFASRLPRVTVFSRGFVPPRVWRASLDGQGVLQSGVMWSVSGSVLRGINQPVAFDLNLRPDAAFQNAAEGGRPVYVSPSAIDPATGLASLAASRRLSDLGTVREVTGMGRSRTVQFSASANKILGRLGILGWTYGGVGYTWTDARETVGAVSAPGGSAATTAGNATRLEWAPAGYAPRHVVQVYGSAIRSSRLALGLVANLASGTSFTPLVAGDVNGDGLVNDRAFIFDPRSAADPVVAQGMDRLLAAAPSGVRRCLRAQAGRVADHNGCRTRWSHSLDLNARLQFGSRLEDSPHRRVTFWVVASNVTAGLDYLLHRADGLRGWGQAAGVDNRLLTVRGFDPAARTFQYDVNPRFGSPSDQALLQRTPFSLSLQMRVVLGTDRPLRAFNEARDAMSNRVQAFAPANVRLHLERQLANAPAAVLALNAPERLYLEPAQALRLQQAADSIAPRIESVVSALVGLVAVTPGVVPAPVDADAVRGLAAEAVALRAAGLETVRSILSAEQWAKLPESLRSPGPGFVPYPPEQLTASSSY